jgi:dipeptidyl aminopeptidase/acylaminoacyl peptidase
VSGALPRLLLALALAGGLASLHCQPAPSGSTARSAPAASLPADVQGTLTYQRDGNIYVLPLVSKAERKLTDFPPASPAVFSARSPDGSRLAYVRQEGLGSVLYVANGDGTDPRKLLDVTAAGATLERLQWTPAGDALLYTYHGFLMEGTRILGELFRAERLDPAGGSPTVLAEDAEGPSMAPSGAIAFVRTTRTGQQLVVREPGGAERVLVAERSFVSLAAPRFSRDGKRLAFVAVGEGPQVGAVAPPWALDPRRALTALRDALGPRPALAHGEPWDIWLAELGGGVRRVNKLAEDEPTVAWSADDRYLAVSGGTGVYIIEVASGQATQLTRAGGFGGIDWTP